MSVTADTISAGDAGQTSIFSRVLVGVDGSAESVDAAVQAARLVEPDGQLTLLSVYHLEPTLIGGSEGATPVYLDEELHHDAAIHRLERVRRKLSTDCGIELKAARGWAWHQLLHEAERGHNSLIAIGARDRGRMLGMLLGSTATALIHAARCSVLVSRVAPPAFPSAIVVGVDGSLHSLVAAETAIALANRYGATVEAVAATGGDPIDDERLLEFRRRFGIGAAPAAAPGKAVAPLRWSHESPVDALLAASASADLLIVGSRGRRRLAALGRVSQRVAHAARCSVLIVREPGGTGRTVGDP